MHLPFPIATYHDRLARVRKLMAEDGLDVLVVTTPDAVHWLSGFDTIGYLWPQALVIDRSDGEPTLVTRTSERPGVADTSWLQNPNIYDIANTSPSREIAETIRRHNAASGVVGIDLQAFTLVPAIWEELKTQLPQARWSDTSNMTAEARLIKEPAEITYQRQAAAIADEAMARVTGAIRPGISEVELAGIAAQELGAAGSEYAAIPPMVVSGERTTLVHGLAGRRAIARGDLVCIELAGVVHRYHAVLMRTVSIGEPTPRARQVANCLERATKAAIEASQPGVAAAEPDHACNAVLDEQNLVGNRCHRIGYSLGLAYPPGWLEPMTLVDGDPHVLAPNMSFTIEPNLTLPNEGFGMKLGETVLCTPAGPQRLSATEPSLTVVEGRP